MSDLKTRVETFLTGLGTTADEVAESLRRIGASGPPEDGCDCPIADALRRTFPEAREENGARWEEKDGCWFVTRTYVRTPGGSFVPPQPIREFIGHFDGYPYGLKYQDLKEER